jgi:hypothetical protein
MAVPQGLRVLECGCGACYFRWQPGVAELADAADSKSAGALLRVGSTPSKQARCILIVCFPVKYAIFKGF